jgi:ubiquinol-cytochrome c reductase cytochrome b subunit
MLGSNFAMLALILHVAKAVSWLRVVCYEKFIVWLVGAVLFLVSLGTAFTGYVLVAGNMSFWAAIVILNLATVVPVVADVVVPALLGDAVLSSFGIRRFAVLHFSLALVSLGLVIAHLVLLHRTQPSNCGLLVSDGFAAISHVLLKDLVLLIFSSWLLSLDVFWALIHPDNWNGFDLVSTPEHIEPEIYFLWTFAIIKLHNSKLAGVVIQRYLGLYSSFLWTSQLLSLFSKRTF